MCKQAHTAENVLDEIRLTETERVEKCLAERDGFSARLQEFFAALCRNMKAREEKKDKAINTLIKIRRPYEQARARMVMLRVTKASELRNRSKSSLMKQRRKIWSFRLCWVS